MAWAVECFDALGAQDGDLALHSEFLLHNQARVDFLRLIIHQGASDANEEIKLRGLLSPEKLSTYYSCLQEAIPLSKFLSIFTPGGFLPAFVTNFACSHLLWEWDAGRTAYKGRSQDFAFISTLDWEALTMQWERYIQPNSRNKKLKEAVIRLLDQCLGGQRAGQGGQHPPAIFIAAFVHGTHFICLALEPSDPTSIFVGDWLEGAGKVDLPGPWYSTAHLIQRAAMALHGSETHDRGELLSNVVNSCQEQLAHTQLKTRRFHGLPQKDSYTCALRVPLFFRHVLEARHDQVAASGPVPVCLQEVPYFQFWPQQCIPQLSTVARTHILCHLLDALRLGGQPTEYDVNGPSSLMNIWRPTPAGRMTGLAQLAPPARTPSAHQQPLDADSQEQQRRQPAPIAPAAAKSTPQPSDTAKTHRATTLRGRESDEEDQYPLWSPRDGQSAVCLTLGGNCKEVIPHSRNGVHRGSRCTMSSCSSGHTFPTQTNMAEHINREHPPTDTFAFQQCCITCMGLWQCSTCKVILARCGGHPNPCHGTAGSPASQRRHIRRGRNHNEAPKATSGPAAQEQEQVHQAPMSQPPHAVYYQAARQLVSAQDGLLRALGFMGAINWSTVMIPNMSTSARMPTDPAFRSHFANFLELLLLRYTDTSDQELGAHAGKLLFLMPKLLFSTGSLRRVARVKGSMVAKRLALLAQGDLFNLDTFKVIKELNDNPSSRRRPPAPQRSREELESFAISRAGFLASQGELGRGFAQLEKLSAVASLSDANVMERMKALHPQPSTPHTFPSSFQPAPLATTSSRIPTSATFNVQAGGHATGSEAVSKSLGSGGVRLAPRASRSRCITFIWLGSGIHPEVAVQSADRD